MRKAEIERILYDTFESSEAVLEANTLRLFIEANTSMMSGQALSVLFLDDSSDYLETLLHFRVIANQDKFKKCMKFGILGGVNNTQKTEWGIEGLPNLTSYLALEKSVGNL